MQPTEVDALSDDASPLTGREIRDRREAAGLSMGQLARHLGWSVARLSDMERGISPLPDPEVIRGILLFLEVDR